MEYVGLVTARQLNAESTKKDGSFIQANKNEVFPMQVSLIKGELPGNCLVVDGTVAERIGLSTTGYTLLTAVKSGVHPVHGDQYTLSALPVVGVSDYLATLKQLPAAKIIDTRATTPDPSAAYKEAEKLAMAGVGEPIS